EETQCSVAQSALAAGADPVLLVNVGNDRARDDIPAVIDCNRDDRLNVKFVLETLVVWPAAEIEIALQRHLDEISDRVVQFFGDVAHLIAGLSVRGFVRLRECRRRDHRSYATRQSDAYDFHWHICSFPEFRWIDCS